MKKKTWAEREVELACKRENPNWDGKSFDYGCACYQSALKAYKSLSKDGHSGFSWNLTKNILIRLMNGQPLTPITDDDFKEEFLDYREPEDYLKEHNLKSDIQCYRMHSLFRRETLDGKVTYLDVNRCYGQDIHNPNDTYQGGGIDKFVDELFPITMPYYPSKDRYVVFTETSLHDKALGDFDLRAYLYVKTPEGEKVEINRFYRSKVIGWYRYDSSDSVFARESEFFEITKEEYEALKKEQIESKPGPNDEIEIKKSFSSMPEACISNGTK